MTRGDNNRPLPSMPPTSMRKEFAALWRARAKSASPSGGPSLIKPPKRTSRLYLYCGEESQETISGLTTQLVNRHFGRSIRTLTGLLPTNSKFLGALAENREPCFPSVIKSGGENPESHLSH